MIAELVIWLPSCAALLHFVQLPSMRLARRQLDWDNELRRLQPLNRRLVVLFGAGILACVAGLGLLVLASHGQLLQSPTGRALCLFLAVFWLLRGLLQTAVFGALWPRSLIWLHRCLALLYPALGLAYTTAWVLALRVLQQPLSN